MNEQGLCLVEVNCIKCGAEDVFVDTAPPKFICNNCMEKERNKE